MPRDAGATRDALIAAGRSWFAKEGAQSAPLKRVVETAGQKNTSALHYHFGGREGLLAAIIATHNADIEERRKALLDRLPDDAPLGDFVEAVVAPLATLLETEAGRQFLSIISQLVDLFERWDEHEGATPPEALRAFRAIERRLPPQLEPALRRERITRLLQLVTEALGSRARLLDRGRAPALPTDSFVANLTAMAVGALNANAPSPTRPSRPARAGSR